MIALLLQRPAFISFDFYQLVVLPVDALHEGHVVTHLQTYLEENGVEVGAHHHGVRFVQVLGLHALLIHVLLVYQIVTVPLQLRARDNLVVAPEHHIFGEAQADFAQVNL